MKILNHFDTRCGHNSPNTIFSKLTQLQNNNRNLYMTIYFIVSHHPIINAFGYIEYSQNGSVISNFNSHIFAVQILCNEYILCSVCQQHNFLTLGERLKIPIKNYDFPSCQKTILSLNNNIVEVMALYNIQNLQIH